MATNASASASASTLADPRFVFLDFLRTTEYPDCKELYDFYTPSPDLHTTITIHCDSFKDIIDYIDTYIIKYVVMLESLESMWVPCDHLCYIHKEDQPFFLISKDCGVNWRLRNN